MARNETSPASSEPAFEAPSPAAFEARDDAYAQVIACAQQCPSQPQFLASVLRVIARHFRSPYAALHVRYAAEVVQEDWHTGSGDPNFWKPGVQTFLTDSLTVNRPRARLLKSKAGDTCVAFLSAPLHDPSGPAIGALALVAAPIEEQDLAARLASLEALARLASFAAAFLGSEAAAGRRGQSDDYAASRIGSTAPLAQAVGFGSLTELAFAVVNDLCNRLGCQQVALGMVRRQKVDVLAVSGLDTLHRQSPGMVALRGAMEECLDARRAIVLPAGTDDESDTGTTGYRLHAQWQAACTHDAVASVLLRVHGQPVAVVSLRRSIVEPFTAEQIGDLRARLDALAPAIELLRRADRGVVRHALDGLRRGANVVTSPGRAMSRVLVASGVLLLGTLLFGTWNYEIAVPAAVAPARVRHLAAPFEAVLADAPAVQGDVVRQGQLLCAFDDTELRQQQRQLLAEWRVAQRSFDRALAEDSPVEAQLARAQQELVDARLAIVQRRIDLSRVRAPFDGIVIRGDHRKGIGGVVKQGEPLFELAPMGAWTFALRVPDAAAAELTPALSGFFATFARPEKPIGFTVDRVLPEAEIRDHRNVFLAEARPEESVEWLRPGMEGVAKVHVGRRPIWWILLHRMIDYLRIHLWL